MIRNRLNLALNVFSYHSKFTDIPEIRRNAECNSDDKVLSENAKDVFACRKLCEEKPDCYFYIFGKGVNYGWCYWEDPELPKTDDQNVRNKYNKICKKEGWQDDQYDFYQVLSMSI